MPLIGHLFQALWGLWAVTWFAMAWGNKKAAWRPHPAWRVGGLAGLIVIALVLRQYPDYFGRRLLPRSEASTIVCLVATAAGIALTLWARIILATNWSATPMIKEGHELVQTGPYALVRHPIYTGLILAILATCAADDRVKDAYLFGLTVVTLVWKLKTEESLMLRQFPAAYPEYQSRTKALIPWLY